MLRRRFILPITTPRNNSSTTTCTGICSTTTSLFAPAFMWQRRFCTSSSSSARGFVEFTGDYVDRRGRDRPWSAVKDSGELKPVNEWMWPFTQQFMNLAHEASLKLPKARKMEPAMQVFAKLDIDDKVLCNQPRDKKTGAYIPVYKHCDIEGVMKDNGFMPELDDAHYIAASAAERKLMLAQFKEKDREVGDILKNNRRMVDELASARVDERNSSRRNENQIDVGAAMFLQLCGFDDRVNFAIKSKGFDFRIFGKTCHSEPDWYMVESVNKDLVLIFEDKSVPESVKTLPSSGHLGQVVGEMLMMLSLNREQKTYRSVFGIRYINSHVCGFRLAPSKQQLDTLVESRNVPNKKLKLLCTEEDPVTSRGWSLIDKAERSKALRLMADIREFILTQ